MRKVKYTNSLSLLQTFLKCVLPTSLRCFLTLTLLLSVNASFAQPFVIQGPTAASIQPGVEAFRAALGGGTVAGANGSFGGLRREINWDGVPDAFAAPNNLPPNFFNANSPRGVILATPGTGFQVSANASNPTGTPVEFGNINPTYPSLFAPFSAQRLFTPLGSNITDVTFFVPGTNILALTRGFGAVFSDVDVPIAFSKIEYFDQSGTLLTTIFVPSFAGNETFAFVGYVFPTPIVSKVRITTGTAALVPNEILPVTDLVVMDDFIYGEPFPIATPCTLTCPSNITVSNTTGQCGAVVNYPAPTTSGTCGTITASPASGSFFTVGTTTVNVSSTSGQTCSFTVTVNDTQNPVITSCPTVSPFCVSTSGNYTIPALTATDNCPSILVNYSIKGATIRTGTNSNASGAFNSGTSTIDWTVTDAKGNKATCQTTVTVNTNPTVTIADAYALSSGVAPNTVYIGHAPASSITLTAIPSGTPPYTYTWSNGSHAASITVSPTITTTYTVSVQNGSGCTGTASKTIHVVDVRCGNKMDKVEVCQVPPGNPFNAHGICVSSNAVAAHLNNGSYLGACTSTGITTIAVKGLSAAEEKQGRLRVLSSSNPAPHFFTLITTSNSAIPLQVKVWNALGRVVEVRNSVAANATFNLGQAYRPGLYFAEVVQGSEKVVVKLVKGNN